MPTTTYITAIKTFSMGPLRFIGIIISLALLLTSCSQKISKLDYDKQVYEYKQLSLRYELLKRETDGNTAKGETPPGITKVSNDVNLKEFNSLKQKYDALLEQQTALERAYEELREEHYKVKEVTPPGSVPVTAYNELKQEKEVLANNYAALEKRYNSLKEVTSNSNTSTINTAEIIEPTEIDPSKNMGKGKIELEETSIDVGSSIIQSTSVNGLFFDYDTYERTGDFLILEVGVKNNSQTNLKTFWNAKKVQIIGDDNKTYTSNSFRIGVDYANKTDNTLTKRIKDANTVFARFAFEGLPDDVKHIKSLKFIVEINGEERIIELTHINVSEIEYN